MTPLYNEREYIRFTRDCDCSREGTIERIQQTQFDGIMYLVRCRGHLHCVPEDSIEGAFTNGRDTLTAERG